MEWGGSMICKIQLTNQIIVYLKNVPLKKKTFMIDYVVKVSSFIGKISF